MKREEWEQQEGNLYMDERGRLVYYNGHLGRWLSINVGVSRYLHTDYSVVSTHDDEETKTQKIEEYLSKCKCFFSTKSFEDVDAIHSALFSSSLKSKDYG